MIIKGKCVLEDKNTIKKIRNEMINNIFEYYNILKKQRTKPVIYKKK